LFDQYGVQQHVIDGGIIGNNPSLFAYLMATQLNKKGPKLRILSLGTGVSEIKPIDPLEFTRFDWLKMSGDLMIDVDVFNSDGVLQQIMSRHPNASVDHNYLRI